MFRFGIILGYILFCTSTFAAPPNYGSGKPTTDKINYCQKLVKRFGHRSQSINDDYYGLGVQRPAANKWSLRTKVPGWFSSDLYLIFEQKTKERYDDFTHRLVCHWDEDGFFTFTALHHTYGDVIICSWSAYIKDEYDCP